MRNTYKVTCKEKGKNKGVKIFSFTPSGAAEYYIKTCLDCDDVFRENVKKDEIITCEVVDVYTLKEWNFNFKMIFEPTPILVGEK